MSRNDRSVSFDGLFKQNIVFMSGLLTAPVIVAATTVEQAVVLVISFFLMSYTSILLCRFIPQKIAYTVRTLLYAVVAAGMFIPTMMLLERWFPQATKDVMLYIELLVVNSPLLAKTESRFYLEPYPVMLLDAFIYVLGYALAVFIVGTIRELLAFGTFYGIKMFTPIIPAARLPFFGFILVGILAAVWRAGTIRRSKDDEFSGGYDGEDGDSL